MIVVVAVNGCVGACSTNADQEAAAHPESVLTDYHVIYVTEESPARGARC